ncbi:ABC transporter ATP-binding protein/permease [Candidatus Methylocalor cossyra]|uniref:ATP-binding cassette transporter n=1 Tax=Candidatus Methylocalor cossyra TaxID=3108543 RepID=A0ABM9NGD3_9GAMM
MNAPPSADRSPWRHLERHIKLLAGSEIGPRALAQFALLVGFLFASNGLNVVNSYVGRDFMTAIAERDRGEFLRQALFYVAVFAGSTVVAVLSRFTEESLGLLWRQWLTRRAVHRYLGQRVYFRLATGGTLDNPDQRIAEDIRAFTVTSLSFVLMGLNGSFTVVAFAGVLWTISPLLFIVAVLYAGGGSYLTVRLGRPLVRLNYDQLDREADFRSALVHVGQNADLLALTHREGRQEQQLQRRLEALVENFRRIIRVNRNLGFFTTGYNWLIQLIPALLVAPMFFDGRVEFGVITQSAMAFTQLLGAFSLIVTQFQSISSFAAVITRLERLADAIEGAEQAARNPALTVIEDDRQVAYQGLTLRSPRSGRRLVGNLSATFAAGRRVLVVGPDETARAALFQATAGIWEHGEGTLVRPNLERILFLPERPYLPPGVLRHLLLRTGQEAAVSDQRIWEVLAQLELDAAVRRLGGLDADRDWDSLLSLAEQQSLAVARVLLAAPSFAFLDRPATALEPPQVERVLALLDAASITSVVFEPAAVHPERFDAVLELLGDGTWVWRERGGAPQRAEG